MWTLRRGHKHIGSDTLAEYIDGRLAAAARIRVDQDLASCAACREELAELRATVSLLQQLPVASVPRSFTMTAPPPQLAAARASAPMRMPQWVYAGAASAAAVVLAVLISADATGLLKPETPPVARESAVAGQIAPSSPDQTSAIQDSASAPAVTLEAEQEVSLQAAMAAPQDAAAATEPMVAQAQAAPEAATTSATAPAAPEAAQAAAEVASAQAMPTPMAGLRTGDDGQAMKSPPPTAVHPIPVPSGAESSATEPEAEGTAAVWRVVEGIAAVIGLVFLAGLLLRRRFRWGTAPR
ncbi:MAG: hypothetical protein BZY88_11405 [SAR202 cluster bacterium Io17-Chloro-G9]|nr:MAG: hypothetical protein BZY88_11405 [SAR202 cluster bacterium Io17-Chloro-G9]